MNISAVIFDLDGTILDDEDVYGMAFNKVLKSLGVETGLERPHTKGIGVKENWPLLISKYNIKTNKTVDELANETQQAYLSNLTSISVRPGFDEFVEELKESGLKVALATSNTWEITDQILDKTDLSGIFDEITTSDEVIYNKPDPDLFNVTADKLGLERNDCLVIEDAPSGVTAAHRAGMKVIAISEGEVSKELENADLVVQGFSDITPKTISEL